MRRSTLVVLAVLGVALLVTAGTVVAHVVADDDAASMVSPSPAVEQTQTRATPSGVTDSAESARRDTTSRSGTVGSGSGRDVDVEAARQAGVAAVARTREVFEAGAISRRDVIAEFTTARFAPELADRTSQQLVELLFGLRRTEGRAVAVSMLSQPVTARAEAIAGGRVAVSVWTVSVFVAEGHATAPEQWSTVHVEVVAEEGRWLVDGWEVTAGPSPVPSPEGVFGTGAEVSAVLSWPSAVGGVG